MASRSTKQATLEIAAERGGTPRTVPITAEVFRLGRDNKLEVQIDGSATTVSRLHAEIRLLNGQFQLSDLNSFNGTFLNGQRVTSPARLADGDRVELGFGGPVLYFRETACVSGQDQSAVGVSVPNGGRGVAPPARPGRPVCAETNAVARGDSGAMKPRLFFHRPFNERRQLTIGRAEGCDIRLDGLLISNRHALIKKEGEKIYVEDAGSTNGTYLNGVRLFGREALGEHDSVQIGPFMVRADAESGVTVYDTRAKTRIDVAGVVKLVRGGAGKGVIRLLDGISLTVRPNEFVGVLGPSGAGKSTLMDALNGMRPPCGGRVLINSLDLYRHLDLLKQQIGYVPQDDIIYRELTVYRTLYHVAKLRLSRDVSAQEIDQIIAEVLDLTGLSGRGGVPVSKLSGGQRKRVSIATELMTKPSVIFLDEPTSGLDPATEEKIMLLFRQIAESGRSVILTTHAMENVRLFDKIVVLMRGRLVFYGAPHEALAFTGATSFKDLYDKLESPVAEELSRARGALPATREEIAEGVAEAWKERFEQTEQYRRNVTEPGVELGETEETAPARERRSLADALRQLATLARRYSEVLGRDKFNLLILFGQAPIIALLIYLVVGADAARDFPFFMLALSAIWFGASVAAREIIRERAIYKRERMVNLQLLPYVGSKLLVLSAVVGLQCLLLFGPLKLLDLAGLMKLPGPFGGLPQFGLMVLTGMVGVALGLFISAAVKTSEMATSLVPLILIPQILFSGIVGVPRGGARIVGQAMPTTWAFDGMKRLSGLGVLRGRDEGAAPPATNEGRGLYKQIEFENDRNAGEAGQRIEQYRAEAEKNSADFDRRMAAYEEGLASGQRAERPAAPKLGPAPSAAAAHKLPDDLSAYVDFLHPQGGVRFDAVMLLAMFFALVAAATLTLRAKDTR